MAAKLGDFFVNIDTKADNKGIKEVSTGLDGLIGQAKKLSIAYLAFKTAKDLTVGASSIVKDAAELGRLSQDLGIATEDLEAFGRAFEVVGAGADEAISTVRTLTKAITAIPMGDEGMAEAFGILGLGPQNFGADAIKNFDAIRKRFNQLNSAKQLYFVNTIGLGEKSLRVLRLNDEEYQNLLETSREAPLITNNQLKQAERFARLSARAGYAKDSAVRSAAIATEPALSKAAELIRIGGVEGAEFINARFTETDTGNQGEQPKSKVKTFYNMFRHPTLGTFTGGPVKKGIEKITDFFSDWGKINKKPIESFLGKNSATATAEEIKNNAISRQVSQAQPGEKTVVINNNFHHKTDIQIKEARELQNDLARHVASIVEDVFDVTNKQAAQNFKKGAIQ